MASTYTSSVFINCPFDEAYKPMFDAIVFSVLDSGFTPRCAMEIADSAQVRIDKIFQIIEECKYAIHDLSRTELDPRYDLPRFNMPLELGMFLGVRHAGEIPHREKACLVIDTEQFRYQRFISDISGQDIKAHANDPKTAVGLVRDWLNAKTRRRTIPGKTSIWIRFEEFTVGLPNICSDARLEVDEMTYNDFVNFASEWLKEYG